MLYKAQSQSASKARDLRKKNWPGWIPPASYSLQNLQNTFLSSHLSLDLGPQQASFGN